MNSLCGTATAVKATVAGSSVATQFLETVEDHDYLQNQCLSVLTPWARKKQEGLLQRLARLRRTIDKYYRHLLISEVWLAHQEYLSSEQVTIWKKERAKN
eukprot:2084767-Rhodomonas_salina.1